MNEIAVAIVNRQPVLSQSLSAHLSDQAELRVVDSASTAAELADVIAIRCPDVLVVDAEFNPADGIEILEQLQAMPCAPGVVVLIRERDRATAANALRLGAEGFVVKSAPVQDLVNAIRCVAQGQKWVSPPLLTVMLSEHSDSEADQARQRLATLTRRELDVLTLLVEGLSQKNISARLHVSGYTVRSHSQNLQKKLGVHSAVAAVSLAHHANLVPAA
jgi:DNA-binding NarL/FixJ family response regulator